ncbi:zinc finger protein 285-like isoform X2 [Epinephelus moara]|uniref:zinc finger protein 285-like isoform X2 n=1 Tax=Epinephelus moara TaxID=300413 RepID=UPI00214F5DC9|nr:zinc finger protein 285-like isoform X2 [Epinephelus moara]
MLQLTCRKYKAIATKVSFNMCSVDGCDSWRRGAQRFKLPEDPERRLEWVQFVLEVNGQRLKESSWTDITICRHHFTEDCFINQTQSGTVQLKPSALPSLCVKSEPAEPEVKQELEEPPEVDSQCDQQEKCDSPPPPCSEELEHTEICDSPPPPCSEESQSEHASEAAQQSPAPSDAPDPDYGQMIQKVANIDMIRKKAALLQMQRKFVVNEKRLLQLFSHKCPLCGSKVKTEKVTFDVVIILNQQCLKCEYRNQWKSQVNAKVPTAEEKHLVEVVEVDVTPETQQKASTDDNRSTITGVSKIVAVIDERDDSMDDTEESSYEDAMDSDEDWYPDDWRPEVNMLSEEKNEDEKGDSDDQLVLPTRSSGLCAECGRFFCKSKPHICEHKIKPYACNICGKRCVSEVALNFHSRIHDENYEHPCKYCHATFRTKLDKITHEQIHSTQEKPYKCPDCSETFATHTDRRIHLANHRLLKCQEDWNPEDWRSEANMLFEEESEDENGDSDDQLVLPTRSSGLCTECGRFFRKSKPHTCEHKIKPYACNICGKRCVSQVALNVHSRVHDENYEHPCKYCHATFRTKGDKITHEQIHSTQEKPYKCPECSKTFATHKVRRIHLANHRLLKCHICGMEFTSRISLRRHMPVHTGLKQFQCSVCQRGFKQSTHLKSHMRLHTGEKPFKCQHCDKCFTHNVSLKSHVQRYHTSNSGPEWKKGKRNKTVSGAVDGRENGNKRVADSGLDNVEEQDTEENVQKNSKAVIKAKNYRSTGRPIGRPKRNTAGHLVLAGEMQGQRLNTKTAKAKARKLKRSHNSDEESEDELTQSDMSFDSTEEEEENSDKVTSSTSRSKRKANNADSDSDFDPVERQKKRYSSQSGGHNSGKRRGRPRKNQVVEDT